MSDPVLVQYTRHYALMHDTFLIFLFAFSSGLLFYRLLFEVMPCVFRCSLLSTFFGARFHHWHAGILLILVGTVILIMNGDRSVVLGLLGVGLGLTIDVFIPFFYIKMNRDEELREYRRSLLPTLLFALGIVAIVAVLSLRR